MAIARISRKTSGHITNEAINRNPVTAASTMWSSHENDTLAAGESSCNKVTHVMCTPRNPRKGVKPQQPSIKFTKLHQRFKPRWLASGFLYLMILLQVSAVLGAVVPMTTNDEAPPRYAAPKRRAGWFWSKIIGAPYTFTIIMAIFTALFFVCWGFAGAEQQIVKSSTLMLGIAFATATGFSLLYTCLKYSRFDKKYKGQGPDAERRFWEKSSFYVALTAGCMTILFCLMAFWTNNAPEGWANMWQQYAEGGRNVPYYTAAIFFGFSAITMIVSGLACASGFKKNKNDTYYSEVDKWLMIDSNAKSGVVRYAWLLMACLTGILYYISLQTTIENAAFKSIINAVLPMMVAGLSISLVLYGAIRVFEYRNRHEMDEFNEIRVNDTGIVDTLSPARILQRFNSCFFIILMFAAFLIYLGTINSIDINSWQYFTGFIGLGISVVGTLFYIGVYKGEEEITNRDDLKAYQCYEDYSYINERGYIKFANKNEWQDKSKYGMIQGTAKRAKWLERNSNAKRIFNEKLRTETRNQVDIDYFTQFVDKAQMEGGEELNTFMQEYGIDADGKQVKKLTPVVLDTEQTRRRLPEQRTPATLSRIMAEISKLEGK